MRQAAISLQGASTHPIRNYMLHCNMDNSVLRDLL